jgi:hypothetical protein
MTPVMDREVGEPGFSKAAARGSESLSEELAAKAVL